MIIVNLYLTVACIYLQLHVLFKTPMTFIVKYEHQ